MLQKMLEPTSLLEIGLLFLFFYMVLTLIRGTRGAALLKGMISIFVIMFIGIMLITEKLGMSHIRQMLEWLLSGSFIVMVIIFSPEIRRGILKLAQSPFLSPLLTAVSDMMITEVVRAAVQMSKRRMGGLITIERDVGLSEYTEGAVKVDSAVSNELIQTIFYPGSALHDGAVVIRNDRVVAAGCLFPLTDNPDLPKSMGTRHRAAIGITEETDAISVAISEETGAISLCVRGKLTSDLNEEALTHLLHELYTRNEKRVGVITEMIKKIPHHFSSKNGTEAPKA